MNPILKRILPHITAVLAFLALCSLYFLPQLQGKVVQQGDVIQYRGMTQEILEFYEKSGRKPLWTNAMFGGMPTYQINMPNRGNLLSRVEKVIRLGIDHPIGRFLAAMVGFYIMMVVLGVNKWLSLIGAIAFGFTTNNFVLYEAGHITKLRAISYFPLIAAGMLLSYRKSYLWGGVVFALGLGLNIHANHPQMSYYLALTIPFFAVARLLYDLRRQEAMHFIKASAILLAGALVAVGASTASLWTTYEYSRSTMRGEPILEQEDDRQARAEAASSSQTEGLAWDYAMQWSNGTIDIFSSFIPGAAGGSGQEPLPDDSAIVQDIQSKMGQRLPSDFRFPLYWGDLPFTSGPIYFGAVMVFLALVGFFLIKEPVKWWVGLGSLLTFMLSMGDNLETFNRLVFDYLPLYNKFRTPNSVLSISSFLFPLLGVLALNELLQEKTDRKRALRALYWGGGIAAAIAAFFILLGPSFFDFSSASDQRYVQAGYSQEAIVADRKALMRSDAWRSLALVLLSGGLIWAYLNQRVRMVWVLAGVGLLTLFDVWAIGNRYLNHSSFVSKNDYQANFQPRPVDQQILQDADPNYRVLDLTVNTYQSAKASYFHKTIGGYHAAKLQRYQDLIDRHLRSRNQDVLDMLNTRYFIVPGGQQPNSQPRVQRNPNAMGNAWFVDTIRQVPNANAEINALNNFRPERAAIVHQEFSDYVQGLDPDPNGSIRLTNYRPDDLTYQCQTPTENLAVFSEIWYKDGWQAYIDGEPADHIRVNYALRALRVPAGEHTIRFKFEPKSYYTGKPISLAFSSLIIAGLLGMTIYSGYNWRRRVKEEPAAPKKAAGKGKKAPEKGKARRRRKG